ncbi:MAG: excisionase family DNA-binding protein [Actinomycetota bacterium]
MTKPATHTRPKMLLSVTDVASELGCGRDTVYTLLANGAFPSVRLGGRLRRIRRCDLEGFVSALPPSLPTGVTP